MAGPVSRSSSVSIEFYCLSKNSSAMFPSASFRIELLLSATDFSSIPGPISTGGPIARASEAVGGAGVPCAGRVLRGIRRGGCVRYCHELIGGCAEVSSAVVATPLAGTASIVVCGGANTWRGSGASHVFVAVGRCAGSVVRRRDDGWQGSRSSVWGAGR